MKILLPLLLTLLLVSSSSFAQMDRWQRVYFKPTTISVTVANPLDAMFKVGGGLEYRRGNRSYTASYYQYFGAYYGKMYDFEWRRYLRRQWEHIVNKWNYQDFFHIRSLYGKIGYDGTKFYPLNDIEKRYSDPVDYVGLAAGYGRRYNKGAFFLTVRGGLRAPLLIGTEDANTGNVTTRYNKSLYRTFLVSGPGSILEFNLQIGIGF